MSAPSLLKREFFGGPCDGDKRAASARMFVRVAGDNAYPVHEYTPSDRGMEWQGIANPRNASVVIVRPGTER